jgi:putative spermidine/putrescine transport system ATP-binding protein
MALADLVVVMNAGRIAQAGTPRAVFNQPDNEFVARFMGGHNVISIDGRSIAVRSDRLRLMPDLSPVPARALPGTITEIEYQGSFVQVALATATGAELTAQVQEADFDAAPYAIGAAVLATWDPDAAHPLNQES